MWGQMRMRLVMSMDGLAWYLIVNLGSLTSLTCQRKCKQKQGRGRKKRQFLTEKASDTESLGLFRGNVAHCKHHTEASGGNGMLEQHGMQEHLLPT